MAANGAVSKGGFQPDSDVHISYDEQQKINKFARQNARLENFKDDLKAKQKELQNLEDACDELVLADEDKAIPYMIGEVFVSQNLEETQQMLESAKAQLRVDIENLQGNCDKIKQVMSDLKVQLYARMGSNIHLEAEEE